jgi:hypothetical protein
VSVVRVRSWPLSSRQSAQGKPEVSCFSVVYLHWTGLDIRRRWLELDMAPVLAQLRFLDSLVDGCFPQAEHGSG